MLDRLKRELQRKHVRIAFAHFAPSISKNSKFRLPCSPVSESEFCPTAARSLRNPARQGPVDLQERIDLRWFNELSLEVSAHYVLERAGTKLAVSRQPPETSSCGKG